MRCVPAQWHRDNRSKLVFELSEVFRGAKLVYQPWVNENKTVLSLTDPRALSDSNGLTGIFVIHHAMRFSPVDNKPASICEYTPNKRLMNVLCSSFLSLVVAV